MLRKMIMRIPGPGENDAGSYIFHGPYHTGIILIFRNPHNNSTILNPQMPQHILYIFTTGGIDAGIQQDKRIRT